jgi:hypothetical protein
MAKIEECRLCHCILTDDTWYPSDRKHKHHRCKKCSAKNNAKWYAKNKISRRKEMREYHRKGCISQGNGKTIHTVKRPYSDKCEMCGRNRRKINYHHWDESNYLRALWLCGRCHWIAEAVEGITKPTSLSSKYLKLKQQMESVYV